MATPDRTTLKAAVDALLTKFRANLVASPPTAPKPFRCIEVGASGADEVPRPFLSVRLMRTRPISACNNDKLWEAELTLRIVTDVAAADPHVGVLDAIGAVEDYLDSIIDTGVSDGAEGFDDREWTIEYPKTSAGARLAAAKASQSFVVKVQRQQNRVPA